MRDIQIKDILAEIILFILFSSLAVFVYFFFLSPPTGDIKILRDNNEINYDQMDSDVLRNINTDRIISFKYFWQNIDSALDQDLGETQYGNTLVVHPKDYLPGTTNNEDEGTFSKEVVNPNNKASYIIHYIFNDFEEEDLTFQNEQVDASFCQKVGELTTQAIQKINAKQEIVNIQSINNQECLFYIVQLKGKDIRYFIEQRHRYYTKDDQITRAFTVSATYSEGIKDDELILLRKSLMLTNYKTL